MLRIEEPDLIDRRNLVYRASPGGKIEAVVDGQFVYELDRHPVASVDHDAGTVALHRAPVEDVRLLVRRAS